MFKNYECSQQMSIKLIYRYRLHVWVVRVVFFFFFFLGR